MKTVSDMANELGISIQAVHKRIKKILAAPLYKKEFAEGIHKDMKGKIYLNEKSERILKDSYQSDVLTASTGLNDCLNQNEAVDKPYKPEDNKVNKKVEKDDEDDTQQLYDDLHKLESTKTLKSIDESLNGLSNAGLKVEKVEESYFISELKRKVIEQEKEIKRLREELSKEHEHLREQSNRILSLAEQMTELTRNNQVLLKQEQDKNVKPLLIEENKNVEKNKVTKTSFFGRLFNRNNNDS